MRPHLHLCAAKVVSPWHEIPLFAEGGLLHYINEIPKETSAKFEVATVRRRRHPGVCRTHASGAALSPALQLHGADGQHTVKAAAAAAVRHGAAARTAASQEGGTYE